MSGHSTLFRDVPRTDAHWSLLLERMRAFQDAPDHFEHVILDQSFHRTMVAAPGNAILAEVYDTLRSRQLRVAMTALSINPQRIHRILTEHSQLLDALIAHDKHVAREVIGLHPRPVFDVVSCLLGFGAYRLMEFSVLSGWCRMDKVGVGGAVRSV